MTAQGHREEYRHRARTRFTCRSAKPTLPRRVPVRSPAPLQAPWRWTILRFPVENVNVTPRPLGFAMLAVAPSTSKGRRSKPKETDQPKCGAQHTEQTAGPSGQRTTRSPDPLRRLLRNRLDRGKRRPQPFDRPFGHPALDEDVNQRVVSRDGISIPVSATAQPTTSLRASVDFQTPPATPAPQTRLDIGGPVDW